jgi:hypothetical protein
VLGGAKHERAKLSFTDSARDFPKREERHERETQERGDAQCADQSTTAQDRKAVDNAFPVNLSDEDFLEDIGADE